MKLAKVQSSLITLIFLVLLSFPSLINLNFGLGENIDSYLILERALSWGKEGYIPARSWGNPLYELVVYPLIFHFGITSAKIYSFIWTIIAQGAFWAILTQQNIRGRSRVLGNIVFAVMPLRIISGNTILETSQGAALGLIGLCYFFRTLKDGQLTKRNALASGGFWALAVATRFPYLIMPAAATLTIYFFFPSSKSVRIAKYLPKKRYLQIMWALVLSGLLPYVFLYSGKFGLGNSFIFQTGDLLWIRILKTGIGYVASLGIPACVGLLIGTFVFLIRNPFNYSLIKAGVLKVRKDRRLFFFCVVSLLYGLRMLILPDELEYIYFWTVSLALMLGIFVRHPATLAIIVVLMALPNLFRVHLFQRNPQTSQVEIAPGISPGSLAQERERRLLNEDIRLHGEQYLSQYLKKLGCAQGMRHTDFFIEQLGSRSARVDCILTSIKWFSRLRDYILPSQGKTVQALIPAKEGKILVHQVPVDRGWRRLLKYTPGIDELNDVAVPLRVITRE